MFGPGAVVTTTVYTVPVTGGASRAGPASSTATVRHTQDDIGEGAGNGRAG